MPWIDHLVLKNPLLRYLDRLGFKAFSFPISTFAKANMDHRLQEMTSNKAAGIDPYAGQRPDLLSLFLKAKDDRPDFMTDDRVLAMAVSMSFAGSETTAISLAAVFYFLLKNPRCYQGLMQELRSAVHDGKLEDRPTGLVIWVES